MDIFGRYEDKTKIKEINMILKSHNSCTQKPRHKYMWIPWIWAKCQRFSVKRQLEKGVRALDLRVKKGNNNIIRISHRFESSYTLHSCLEEIESFLKENPREFVFVFIKRDWTTREQWKLSDTLEMWKQLNKYSIIEKNIWNDTKIEEIRNKIIPITENFLMYNNEIKNDDIKKYGQMKGRITPITTWNMETIKKVKKKIFEHVKENIELKHERKDLMEIELNYILWKGIVPPYFVSKYMKRWYKRVLEEKENKMVGILVGKDYI